jgi:hypothetical protein
VPALSVSVAGMGVAQMLRCWLQAGDGVLFAGQRLAWTMMPMTMKGSLDLIGQAWLTTHRPDWLPPKVDAPPKHGRMEPS